MRAAAIARSLAGWAGRWPRAILAATLLLALAAAAAAALLLETDAGTATLVDEDSASFRATERFGERFGDEAVRVLVEGDLRRLVLTSDLGRLVGLEGCLAGNVPPGAKARAGPCGELAELRPARVVYGPGTFINEAANQVAVQFAAQRAAALRGARRAERAARRRAAAEGRSGAEQRRLGRLARQRELGEFTRGVLTAALRYGITSQPALNNPAFVSAIVFDPRRPQGTPKSRFAYLFPSPGAALISIRLRPDLGQGDRRRAIELFRAAVAEPDFRLRNSGGRYAVSGPPVVIDALASYLSGAVIVLLVAALAVMAATLALVFRPPLRLLPLALALAASALVFGAMSLAGAPLTMASIAVLPVLIGLAVDYAIQFQARFNEAAESGAPPAEAAAAAAARGAPVIATAGLATAAGFLALLLSPVPMVRGFGILLVAGIAVAFLCALTAGFAALSLTNGGGRYKILPRVAWRPRFRDPDSRAAKPPDARKRETGRRDRTRGHSLPSAAPALAWLRNAGQISLATSAERPKRILVVAIALATTGWVADSGTEVISDVRQLVPRDLPALRDLNRLQDATGVSGEIDVMVRARDLTEPATIGWMGDFQRRVLKRAGYGGELPTCARARLCPALSLPDLFRNPAGRPSRERVRSLLDAIPVYFSQAVITRDRRTASLAFGIRVMPLDRQQRLIEDVKRQIDPPGTAQDPPAGVSAAVTGLPVLAAEANRALSGSRYWTALAGLAAVLAVLLAVYRSARRALVPLVPIVLATGWSALVLAAMDIPLNPMSATLGALVIAIATEFSVILSSRYHEERAAGRLPGEALRQSYARTGAAVLASGATAIAGFAALIVSDIRMLRDFGFVTVVDLAVALIGVMLVLPAVLVWAEERGLPGARLSWRER